MNKVILIGRTTKDIELKHTRSSKAVVSFSVAVKRTFKNSSGEYESDFFNCVAFGNLAETISRYVHKGDMVSVEGRLQTRTYTDREGNNRYSTETIVENIEFLQPKKQEPEKQEPVDEFMELDPFADCPF